MILSSSRSSVGSRRLFWFTVVAVLVCDVVQPMLGHAETTIIPSVNVRGHYDTNIFMRPAELLAPGEQLSDWKTTVGGAVELLHLTRDLEAKLKVGGTFNSYVEHSNLNYFGLNVAGEVNLDRWVDQYVRGANLSITENFSYTPEAPGFVIGVDKGSDAFLRGQVGIRRLSLFNTTTIRGSVPLSRDLELDAGYMFNLRHRGRKQTDADGLVDILYFDTMIHTWQGGPRYRLTRNDSVAVLYRQSLLIQERASGGRTFNTNVFYLFGEYTKVFPEWTVTVDGGPAYVDRGSEVFAAGSLRVTTAPERNTVVHLTLSREPRPSTYLQSGAIISNLGRVGFTHRFYERLMLTGTVGYSYNQWVGTDETFQSFLGQASLRYNVTRNIIAELDYFFQSVDYDRVALQYQVSKNVVGFFLTAEWK